jgi:hypothetical protein
MAVKFTKPEINVREKLAELDKPSGIAGEAMLRAETPQEQFNLIGAGRRRLSINGDMEVWQRGTSFTGLNSGNTYTADRFPWKVTSAGTWTISREADAPSGFKYSFKALCTSGDSSPTQLRLYHSIEGQDVNQLAYGTKDAKPVSVSFWIKCNVTGTYSCSLETHVTGRQASLNFTIDSAGVWEKKELTFQGDSGSAITSINGTGLTMSVWFGAMSSLGSNGTTDGAWVTDSNYARLTGGLNVNLGATANNYVQITGVQLEVGKVATPFEHRSYGEELALCQRYFVRFNGNTEHIGQNYSGTTIDINVALPVSLRAAPTLVCQDVQGTANKASVYSGGSYNHGISTTIQTARTRGNQTMIRMTGTLSPAGSANDCVQVQFNDLQFNAEL